MKINYIAVEMEEEQEPQQSSSAATTFNSLPAAADQQLSPSTPNTAVSTLHQPTISTLLLSQDQLSSGSINALLATPKRKSLQLDQEEKFPEMLVEHARLMEMSAGSSKRVSMRSHDRTSSNHDAIEEKSEAEEDDQQQPHKSLASSTENMLFGCIVEVIECKSERERHEKDSVTFYSHQSAAVAQPEEFEAEQTEKESRQEQELREVEESINIRNNTPEIICRCALFWRKENCETEDYRRFARLMSEYVQLRMKPKPLNAVGEALLRNGFFVLAFIKYMSMPESIAEAEACDEALNIQDNLFEIFQKEYPLRSNREEFDHAYQDNCRRQAEARMNKISISQNTLLDSQLKRDPTQKASPDRGLPSKARNFEKRNNGVDERKSYKRSNGKAPSECNSQDYGVQTDHS